MLTDRNNLQKSEREPRKDASLKFSQFLISHFRGDLFEEKVNGTDGRRTTRHPKSSGQYSYKQQEQKTTSLLTHFNEPVHVSF